VWPTESALICSELSQAIQRKDWEKKQENQRKLWRKDKGSY